MPTLARLPLGLALLLAVLPACSSDDDPTDPGADPTAPVPNPIRDLRIAAVTERSATLAWTTPGIAGDPRPLAAYDLRRAELGAEPLAWDDWQPVAAPSPAAPGAPDTTTIAELTPETSWVFRLRARGDGPWSSPSNRAIGHATVGTVWHVREDGGGTVATIADAIGQAGYGDLVLVHPGRYTWTNQGGPMHDLGLLFVGRDTTDFTIASAGGPAATILDAEGRGRVLFVQGHNDGLVIEGFTITGGTSTPADGATAKAGGLTFHLTSTTVRDCVFEQNVGLEEGGAVYYGGVGTPTFERCVFRENHAGAYGGAVFAVNVLGPGSDTSAGIRFVDCAFTGNTATRYGGGLCLARAVTRLEDCLLAGNEAGERGGGVSVFGRALSADAPASVDLVRCTLARNTAASGAGLRVDWSGGDSPRPGRAALRTSIVAYHDAGDWLHVADEAELTVGCTVLFGNDGGDVLPAGCEESGPLFTFDPLFRGPNDYGLQADSPCRADGRPDDGCGDIGARRDACDAR